MKYKKSAIAAAMVLAAIGSFFAYRAQESARVARERDVHGIVNPDYPATSMTTVPVPELSVKRIEPRPSLGAGTYTARIPARNDDIDQNTDKKVR